DACGGKIQTERSAEPARTNEQHLGVFELELPLHADFRHDKMAAVAQNFFVGKTHGRFCTGLRLYSGGHCDSLLLQISIRLARDEERFLASPEMTELVLPPAMDGIMLIVSPSFVGVFSFAR